MHRRDLVVVGGSAGAIEALSQLVAGIDRTFPATLLVVVHRNLADDGRLTEVLSRAAHLPVRLAEDGEAFAPGVMYVARSDRHLLVSDGGMRLTHGPREHGFRPAVDPLFRTAARERGPRVVGVILSGALDDGVHGLALVKRHGGVAVVQRVEDAAQPGMPSSALRHVAVDHVCDAADMPGLLRRLVCEPAGEDPVPVAPHPDVAGHGEPGPQHARPRAERSPITCPECGGALCESISARPSRYRCHVGHAFTARALAAMQDDRLESALWAALRTLEESTLLRRRMAARAAAGGLAAMAGAYEAQARRSDERAALLREVLLGDGEVPSGPLRETTDATESARDTTDDGPT